jgi:hypothetical protein
MYGKASLTAVPVLLVRVEIESSGRKRALGMAADCLPPQWFDRDPSRTYQQNVEDLLAAYARAREVYLLQGKTASTVADLWRTSYALILGERSQHGLNALSCSFGSSLLERAVIDALCRLRGLSFFEALEQDLLGLETSKDLPPVPAERFICRHTVGLGDPITVSEISPDRRVDDGLPQALEEDIEFYGFDHFKVELSGAEEWDLDRLSRLAVLFNQRCRKGYRVALDGNEQYRDLRSLENLLEVLRAQPYGGQFLDSVLFVEQPLHRDIALASRLHGDIARFSQLKPLIIDESDALPDSFERAVKMGYRGVSHKNCKGVFKSLANRALVCRLNAESDKGGYFQTGEDLATVPIIALQQDLASLAALGVEQAERNGHHYFHGLDHLPARETAGALASHSDLYEERGEGAFLAIQDGIIVAGSIQAPGYGYACEIAFEQRTPLEAWSFDLLRLESEVAANAGRTGNKELEGT